MALTRIQTAALQSSITGSNITDGSIAAADLASGSVTPAKLSTGGPNWDSSSNMGIGVSAGGSTRLTVTATSGSLSTFTQTSAIGYGLTIVPGADTTYDAFTINNAANSANNIRMFGNGSASFSSAVGVGLASPVHPIHVKKDGQTTGITNVYTIGRFLNDAQNKGLDVGYDNTTNQTTLIAYSGGSASGYDFYAYSGSAWYLPMKLDSSGNLMLGATTTRSSAKLDVRGNVIALGENATYYGTIDYSAGTGFLSLAAESTGGIKFLAGATERMRINSSGNVGIGTNAPTSKLDVSGTFRVYDASGNGIVLYGAAGDSFGGNAAAVIFAGDPGAGGAWYFWKCVADYNGTPDTRAFIHSNGGLYNFSANNSNLSDLRVKRDIALAGSYLDKICAIPVKTFKYKSQTLPEDQEVTLGVIAQDVEAIAPELVNVTGFGDTPEDGIPLKAIYQTDLQYALMKCIQELKAENDSLKARLDAAGL